MTRAEYRWALISAAVVMLITCLPYLYAASLAPPGTTFSGLLYAADDHCVYLSWEQQGAQGRFFMRNLFTNDPQRGIYVSLLSWVLGSVARVTGAPLIFVHHAARIVFGLLLLVLVYRLAALFTADPTIRRAAFWFTALSAGFGWLVRTPVVTGTDAVDLWQPEAITFLCLYVNGLFCVALSLMLGILLLLLGAEGETGARRWVRVLGAGVLGLLLGNIHSYDVITVTGVWLVYLATRAVVERRLPLRALADAVVAGLVALPSTAYQYYLYRTEPVFRMRADDEFLSPPLTSYLLGYGLVVVLAMGGAVWLVQRTRQTQEPLRTRLLPLSWAVSGLAIPYLPFAFQRKLLMGAHIPLAFLAGVGTVALARWVTRGAGAAATTRRQRRRADLAHGQLTPLRRALQGAVVAGLLLLTVPTNWHFIRRDLQIAAATRENLNDLPAFWPQSDLEAIRWARRHLPRDGVVLCSTVNGRLIPALAGLPVYVGHWSETPSANDRMREVVRFFSTDTVDPEERRAFLETRQIRYVFHGTEERLLGQVDLARDPLFRAVYNKGGVAIYEVQSPHRDRQASASTSSGG